MSANLTHYQVGPTLTKCGVHLNPDRLTTEPRLVTCRVCIQDKRIQTELTRHRNPVSLMQRILKKIRLI